MAATKKLVNATDTCVDDMLAGVAAALPGLELHADHRVLLRRQEARKPLRKVGLLSGGGSGHEPFCAGYVGRGMLAACVAGSVFTSPPPSDVLYGIRCLAQQGASGVLLVVANYTGDCLNFGLAAERARALGLRVELVTVGEDCALLGSDVSASYSKASVSSAAGRRGLCGLLFVYKVAGALAESGAVLETVATCARNVTASMATLGICLSPCSLPGAGPLFTLGADEMELGLGVHGEQGAFKMKLCCAREAAEEMVNRLAAALKLVRGNRVAALVNNLGGSSQLEQALMAGELHAALERRGVEVMRLMVGHLMTSLEMAGVQFSLLRLPEGTQGEEWLAALDKPTEAAGWPGCPLSRPTTAPTTLTPPPLREDLQAAGPELSAEAAEVALRGVRAVAKALQGAEALLNQLDSGCGDGDCGSTLKRLADEMLTLVIPGREAVAWPARLLRQLSSLAEARMGGTSGAVYSLLLAGSAQKLAAAAKVDAWAWAAAWRMAIQSLHQYTPARPGDRTLLDALEPACSAFEGASKANWTESLLALAAAAAAAEKGSAATKHMVPRMGRATYVDRSRVQNEDAGAAGVAVWLRALAEELRRD